MPYITIAEKKSDVGMSEIIFIFSDQRYQSLVQMCLNLTVCLGSSLD